MGPTAGIDPDGGAACDEQGTFHHFRPRLDLRSAPGTEALIRMSYSFLNERQLREGVRRFVGLYKELSGEK